jgi:hypothetical protein
MRTWRTAGGCIWILLAQAALAQVPSSAPVKPAGSGTLVVTPRKPEPPVPDPDCVPGTAACPTKPEPLRPARPQRPDADSEVPATEPPAQSAATPALPAAATTSAPVAPLAGVSGRARELLVASADIAESDAQRRWFAQQGIGVLRRRALANLGWVMTVYRIPPGTDLRTVLAEFVSQWPQSVPEENQRYTPQSSRPRAGATARVDYAAALIGMQPGCTRKIEVAMLDGPLNVALPAFAARDIRSLDIAERSARPDYAHATGIAAILLGASDLPGLAPNAALLAVNVFGTQSGKSYTTTEWILRGLDAVLGRNPRPAVVNLSFGGGHSEQLGRAITRVLEHARVVAAAGNDGATHPVYPAAYPGVVAVTAVDARQRRWPRANAGEFISIAAPGVDLWTIDGEGRGYYASGTSFAAAYVTAAIALGAPPQAAVPTWLRLHAADLGSPGRDRLFGFGLIRARGLCE